MGPVVAILPRSEVCLSTKEYEQIIRSVETSIDILEKLLEDYLYSDVISSQYK